MSLDNLSNIDMSKYLYVFTNNWKITNNSPCNFYPFLPENNIEVRAKVAIDDSMHNNVWLAKL